MTDVDPPLWTAILARIDPPLEKPTIDAVHEALGQVVGRGTVQRIRDGVDPSAKNMRKIAEHLGCLVGDLVDDPAGSPAPTAAGVALTLSHLTPIVQTRQVIWEDLKMVDLSSPVKAPLPDDAMGGQYPKGAVLEFDPTRPPRAGWPCLVRDGLGNFYCRDYVQGAGDHWQAVARSAGYLALDSIANRLQYIGGMSAVHYPAPA